MFIGIFLLLTVFLSSQLYGPSHEKLLELVISFKLAGQYTESDNDTNPNKNMLPHMRGVHTRKIQG